MQAEFIGLLQPTKDQNYQDYLISGTPNIVSLNLCKPDGVSSSMTPQLEDKEIEAQWEDQKSH